MRPHIEAMAPAVRAYVNAGEGESLASVVERGVQTYASEIDEMVLPLRERKR